MSDIAGAIEAEMAKIVSDIRSATSAPDTATPTISAALAAITPSANHVARARALGIEPDAHLCVIKRHIAESVETLKQFLAHIPAGDPNAAKVNDLIGRLR